MRRRHGSLPAKFSSLQFAALNENRISSPDLGYFP